MEIKIHGGIGNQLFQYALAARLNPYVHNVYVNLDFYKSDMRQPREAIKINRYLRLEILNKQIKPNFISKFYKKFKKSKLHYLAYILNERFGNVITEHQEFGFRQFLLKRNLNCVVLDGYFADYRYLKDGLKDVLVAFEKLTNKIDISYHQHVAVHIRRGDYTKIMRTNEMTNVLDINYYRRCLEQINNKDLVLRIYTDDYEWAKSEFPILFEGYTFDFSPEKYTDIDSLWTMSKHHYLIGANSTFSLWAYYFGMKSMNKFYFPLEWASSIQNKGYRLFCDKSNNVELIQEN